MTQGEPQVITRLNGKAALLVLGMALMLGACSASAVPSGTSNAQGATSAASQQAPDNGTAAPTSGPAASSDACKLLTQAEVEAAFNETMQAPVASTNHGDATCSYTHEAGGLDLTVAISSRPSNAAAITQTQTAYGDAATSVSGVGDAAFEFSGILEFVKGTTLVTIGTGDGPAIISDANFQALAATAAGRI
jgi:hypothetical protein